jgi:hypothetical protein
MANAPPVSIVIMDYSSGVDASTLVPGAAALQRQCLEHFAMPPPNGWGVGALVRVGSAAAPPLPEEWVLGLFSKPDQPGALGYHDKTPQGLPFLHIFPPLDAQEGVSWTSTASHEILEALADPELSSAAQDPSGTFWALEVCDAVENDSYLIDGVQVSNFSLPDWFEPPTSQVGAKYDWMGLCTAAYEVREGGYSQSWNPSTGWNQQVSQRKAMRAYRKITAADGRCAKRAAKGKPAPKP